MNLQSKFGYCIITQTLNIALCLKAGRNYGRTDRQTNDPITRCPRRTFQAGGMKRPRCITSIQVKSPHLVGSLQILHPISEYFP